MIITAGGAAYAAAPICPHVIGWNSEITTWAKGAPWIKVIYSYDIAPAKATGAKVFYRPWDADSQYHDDGCLPLSRPGTQYAEMVWNKIKDLSNKPEAVGYRNEFNWGDANCSKWTCREFRKFRDKLKSLGYQGKVVFGSFGVGWVDAGIWDDPDLKDACAAADAIETHEYFDLTVDCCAPYLCYRHRDLAIKAHPDHLGNKEWFIGEFGSDRVCGHCTNCHDSSCRGGWRDRNKLTADAYIKQLDIYSKNCSPNVTAVFLFQQGSPGWSDFEVLGTPVAEWMRTTWISHAGGTVAGNVKNGRGNPLSYATVTAECGNANATTDSYGNYSISYVPIGTCNIRVDKPGYVSDSSEVTVNDGTVTTVNFTLIPAYPAEVSGKVKGLDGNSLPGAAVVLIPGGVSVVTDANGEYSVGNLVPGSYLLTASKSGYIDSEKSAFPRYGLVTIVDFMLSPVPVSVATVAQTKAYQDGAAVSLANKVVTASTGSAFWIEEQDRSSGIKVIAVNNLSIGTVVDVSGVLKTVDGERVLDSAGYSAN